MDSGICFRFPHKKSRITLYLMILLQPTLLLALTPSLGTAKAFEVDTRTLTLSSMLRERKYIEVIEDLSKKDPKQLDEFELAAYLKALFSLGEKERIVPLLMTAKEKIPLLSDWINYVEFRLLLDMGRFDRAFQVYHHIESKWLRDNFRKNLYRKLFQNGKFEDLKQLYRREKTSLKDPFLLFLAAKAYYLTGNKKTAEGLFYTLCKRYPQSKLALRAVQYVDDPIAKGIVFALNGKGKEALLYLSKSPKSEETIYAKEISLFNEGKFNKFLRGLKKEIGNLSGYESKIKWNFKNPVERLKYLAGFAHLHVGDTLSTLKIWLENAMGTGKLAEKSAFMLSYLLFIKRAESWAQSFLIKASIELEGVPPYLASRLGLVAIAMGRNEIAKKLFTYAYRHSDDSFIKAHSLFWLYIVEGNPSYKDSLLKEFPLSYYSVTLEKDNFSIHTQGKMPQGEISEEMERFRLFALLGLNDFAYRTVVEDPQIYPYALLFADLIGNSNLAVQISRGIQGKKLIPLLQTAFPLYNIAKIRMIAKELEIEPAIILALIREESSFDPFALSPAWAWGLTQLLYGTAKEVEDGIDDPADLLRDEVNIRIGITYFKKLLNNFGSYRYALAAYNAGPSKARRWIKVLGVNNGELFSEFIPYEETRNYLRRVLRSYWIYKFLLGERR